MVKLESHLFHWNRKVRSLPFWKHQGPTSSMHACLPMGTGLAYESDEYGQREVYVSAFPKPAGRLQVSSAGGRQPKWRGDGKELYYVGVGTQVVAAELSTSNGSVEVVRRRPLFQFQRLTSGYDVFPDGKRFLCPVPTTDIPIPLSLVLNWTADLKK
jgi:eukaryotic-like serine/threonine-protein kinase